MSVQDLHTRAPDRAAADQVLAKFREYTLGPLRFMNLLSCFELGIVDLLQQRPEERLTAAQIGEALGIPAHAVEQLLYLPVKEDFIDFDERSRSYALAGIGQLTEDDFGRVIPWMDMVKVVCLRQLYYLSDSIRTGSLVGLKTYYDFDGNFYEASTRHDDLRASWAAMMDQVTAFIDPWFFSHVEIGNGARVLDLAGNTGLGAILTYRHKQAENPHVTCFDFPEKEAEALANFRAEGMTEHCSFIGGDVFQEVPRGFDIVMIKHFLDMFDKENVIRILRKVHEALEVGGQVYVLVPIYPEDIRSSCSVDFFPGYFLGCTMAQGGPQKLSVYAEWLQEAGFQVTKALSQDISSMPPDVIPVHGILCASKT